MPSAAASSPPTRVVIRLPYNRPQDGHENPPRIEWNAEKETILWEVIARSRASDSAGPDWPGLAAHLAVPLPYLLFRAQTRYEEDLRGLQLHGALGLTAAQPSGKPFDEDGKAHDRPDLIRRISGRTATGSTKLSSSTRFNSPLTVRARLNSLGYDSGHRQSKVISSSIATLQGTRNPSTMKSLMPSPSRSESESDDEAEKADEEERQLEEQEALDEKLRHLQNIMTSDALGFVRDTQSKVNGKEPQRGRDLRSPTSPSPLRQTFQRRDRDPSSSDFNSTTSSMQGSIPSIPSPPPEPQAQLPTTRHLHHGKKSSSPPALSSSQARGQAHMQYRSIAVEMAQASDRSSTHGSNASSFSDISDSTGLSASALESALLSNIRGTGSRFSAFARSQFSRRPSGGMHQ